MPSFSGATAPGKAFSVAPAPVPKLGCVGQAFVRTSPRNFSRVGNEILEGYERGTQQLDTSARKTIVVKEDYGLTTGALLDDYGPCPPEIFTGVLSRTSTQEALARYQDLANENAQTGAWAPNTKKAPPLLRMDTKRYDNSSPRLHSPGPDLKTSLAATSKGTPRKLQALGPVAAHNALSPSFKIKQDAKYANKSEGSRSSLYLGKDRTDDRVEGVAAWSTGIGYPDDTFPHLLVRSLQDTVLMHQRPSTAPTPRKSRNKLDSKSSTSEAQDAYVDHDTANENMLSPLERELLTMYTGRAVDEEGLSLSTREFLTVYKDSMRGEQQQDMSISQKGLPRTKISSLRGHQTHLNVVNLMEDAKVSTQKATDQKSESDQPSVPMLIGSYTPKATPIKPPHNIEIKLHDLEGMQEWRDPKSASRPSSARRPLSANRPISAKGTPQRRALGHDTQVQHLDEADVDSPTDLKLTVEGHHIHSGYALSVDANSELPISETEIGIYSGNIHEALYDDGREILTSEWIPLQEDNKIERELFGAVRKTGGAQIDGACSVERTIVGSESNGAQVDSEANGVTRSRPVSASRATSRPSSAGNAVRSLLPLIQSGRIPALIEAELQMEGFRVLMEDPEGQEHDQQQQEQQEEPLEEDALEVEDVERFTSIQRALSSMLWSNAISTSAGIDLFDNEAEDFTCTAFAPKALLDSANDVHERAGHDEMGEKSFTSAGGNGQRPSEDGEVVTCPSCQTRVPLVGNYLQSPIVLTYFTGESKGASEHSNSGGTTGPQLHALKLLAELKQRMLEMQQERGKEKGQHRVVLKAAGTALNEACSTHTHGSTLHGPASPALAGVAPEKNYQESNDLCEQLAEAEKRPAQAQSMPPAETQHVSYAPPTDALSTPSQAPATPATAPSTAKPPTVPSSRPTSRPTSARALSNSSKTSTPRTPTKQETSVPVTQNDNSIGPPRDKDDFKKQLEMAEAASKGTDIEQNIKAQLATALEEAAAAKEQLDQATKAKDVELEKLRKEIAEHARGHSATTLQKEEAKKLKTELERAKKELEALRKQRDAKLAVHERQALADAQAQLILDQEKFAADNEQLRLAREAAQKEINEAARVEAIRKAVDAKEEKLKTFEAVLNADSVALKSEWQRLRERQSALADELEVACGAAVACEAVKHDKAVLLKELRVTLTENLELTEKCAKLEAEMNRLKAKSTRDGHARSVAQETSLSAHSSRTSSASCLSAPGSAGLPRLPSLNIDHFVPKDQSVDGHRTRASSRASSTDRKEITEGLVPVEGSACRDDFNP